MAGAPDQQRLPVAEALRGYAERDPVVLHIPGHGGRSPSPQLGALGEQLWAADRVDPDFLPGPLPQQQALELAAQAWGAAQAWWLLGGASQGNHAVLLGLTGRGDLVLAGRGSHVSVASGLILSGAAVQWLQPAVHDAWQTLRPLGVDELAGALAALPRGRRPRGVLVTSPTYFGEVADIPALAELCHRYELPLWVDGAWGSHFGFHPGLPENPLRQGADLLLVSTHKHAGSLKGSALLLAGDSPWMTDVQRQQLGRALRWLASTSPSLPLQLGLDAARWLQVNHGRQLWDDVLATAETARLRLAELEGLQVADADLDPRRQDRTRLILDVSSSGWDGLQLDRVLAARHAIFLELASSRLLVAMLSHATGEREIDRLHAALQAELPRPQAGPELGLLPPLGASVLTPRLAATGPLQPVALEQAAGQIAAEIVSVYPPGIPALLPGCRISEELVAYLQQARAAGARIHGAEDPQLRSVLISRPNF